MTPLIASTLIGTVAVLAWRVREGQTPVSLPKIVIPPLGMSTGLCMFLVPAAQIPLSWALTALVLGAMVFAQPLIHTSKLTLKGHQVFMKRSRAFLWVLLGLVAVRFALRDYVGHLLSPIQTGAVFYLLALGMISRWRLTMLSQYLKLVEEMK